MSSSNQNGPLDSEPRFENLAKRSEADEKLIKKYLGEEWIGSKSVERIPGSLNSDWSTSLVHVHEEDSRIYQNHNLRKVKGPVEIKLELSQEKNIRKEKSYNKDEETETDRSINLNKMEFCSNSNQENDSRVVSSTTKMSFSKETLGKLSSSIRQFKRDSGLESAGDFNSYMTKRRMKGSTLKLSRLDTKMDPIKEIVEQPLYNKNLELSQTPEKVHALCINDESLNLNHQKTEQKLPYNITFGKLLTRDADKLKNLSSLKFNSRRSNLRLSEMRNLRKVDENNQAEASKKMNHLEMTDENNNFDYKQGTKEGLEEDLFLSVRSRIARSKELISETLEISSAKKKLNGMKSPNSALKHEFFTINQRIDKLMKFVSTKDKAYTEESISRNMHSVIDFKTETPDKHNYRNYAKGIRSKNSKSTTDVIKSSLEKTESTINSNGKQKEKILGKSQSPSKKKQISTSKPRVSPYGVNTSIQAFGLKNLTIKNIVVNPNPKPNSIKQAAPYQINALKPPKISQKSFLDKTDLVPNKNHHTKLRSFCIHPDIRDQNNIDDQSMKM